MTQVVGSVKDPPRQRQPQDIPAGRAFDDAKTPGRTVRTWFSSGRSCICPDLSGPKHTQTADAWAASWLQPRSPDHDDYQYDLDRLQQCRR